MFFYAINVVAEKSPTIENQLHVAVHPVHARTVAHTEALAAFLAAVGSATNLFAGQVVHVLARWNALDCPCTSSWENPRSSSQKEISGNGPIYVEINWCLVDFNQFWFVSTNSGWFKPIPVDFTQNGLISTTTGWFQPNWVDFNQIPSWFQLSTFFLWLKSTAVWLISTESGWFQLNLVEINQI